MPPVVLKTRFPLMSVVSPRVRLPEEELVPMVTLLNAFPAEVSEVAPSIIHVDPVVVNVSALVKSSVDPAKLMVLLVVSKAAVPPVVLNDKVPLMSAVSPSVRLPEEESVPTMMLLRVFPAEVRVVAPSNIQVEPLVANVSALVKFSAEPAKLTVLVEASKAAVPPVVLKVKLPLMSVVSARERLPESVLVPIVILLKAFPAEVRPVDPSNIQVEPVVINVSAWVRSKFEPA